MLSADQFSTSQFASPMSYPAIDYCSGGVKDGPEAECVHIVAFQPAAHWLIHNRYFFSQLDDKSGEDSIIHRYRNTCGSHMTPPFPKLFRPNDDMQSNFGIAIENFYMPPKVDSLGESLKMQQKLKEQCPNLTPSYQTPLGVLKKEFCSGIRPHNKMVEAWDDNFPRKSKLLDFKAKAKRNKNDETLSLLMYLSSDDWAGYTSAPTKTDLGEKTRCHSSHLCRYPIHCSHKKWAISTNKTSRFFTEVQCNRSLPLFVAFYLLMIMSISTYGNILSIITLVSKLSCPLKMRTTRRRHVKIKLSLTIADLIPAISLLPVMVYYVLSGYGNPSPSTQFHYGMVQNSKAAMWVNVSGVLYVVYLVSTAANLSLLSTERFMALKFPLRNLSLLTDTGCNAIIMCIWVLSIFVSIIPFLMYDYFGYSFDPQVFLNSLIIKTDKTAGNRLHGLFYVFCAFVGPYLYNLILCILTLLTVHKSMSDHRVFDQSQRYISTEREIANYQFFRVTAIMVIGFSITLLPYSIILLLFVAGTLSCGETTSKIFVFATFFSLSASVINAVIYNISSQNFQSEVLSMIGVENKVGPRRIPKIGTLRQDRNTEVKTITSFVQASTPR